MTDPASLEPPSGRAKSLGELYRERAPRIPDQGLDLLDIFSATADIEMEIGFGRGMFLVQRAQAVPGLQLLGLEIKTKLACRVAERVERLGLGMVKVFAGDVRSLLPKIGPEHSVARAFLHFPDPWWKKRHAKRRLAGDELLVELARLLRPGGELFVQTDVEERALDWVAALRAQGTFELSGDGLCAENPYRARSNREQRAVEDGLPIFRVLALRRPLEP